MKHDTHVDLLVRAIVELFEKERFYGEVIIGMDKYLSDKVPTAGVCIKERVELHVNPKFFAGLTLNEQVATLKHEAQHIIYDHISRFKVMAPDVFGKKPEDLAGNIIQSMKFQVCNIAADLSINCNIENLPKGGMYPGAFKLPNGETMEYYFEKLKKDDEQTKGAKYDEHSLWSESEQDAEMLKEKIKQHVKEAGEKTKAAGRLTHDDQLLIDRLNYNPRNWRQDLQRFAAKTTLISLDTSRKKRNRRYGIQFPGTIKVERLEIGVAIDTSGSVSDEALNQFMAEIGNIAKYANITVVEADSEIKNSYVFDPKKTYKVKGRGGTAYQPAFDFFNKMEIDGMIYFGDMDCFDTEEIKKPKYPVMWAIVGNQAPPADFGYKTKIELKPRGNK